MSMCENCKATGLDPRTMIAAKKDEEYLLIGPCCVVRNEFPAPQPTEPEYGLELSSKFGLLAYVRFDGLQLEYRRTPEQLKKDIRPLISRSNR